MHTLRNKKGIMGISERDLPSNCEVDLSWCLIVFLSDDK